MSQTTRILALLLALGASTLRAAPEKAPAAAPAPAKAPASAAKTPPAATPAEVKKPGLMRRVFSKKSAPATPEPEEKPAATPAPKAASESSGRRPSSSGASTAKAGKSSQGEAASQDAPVRSKKRGKPAPEPVVEEVKKAPVVAEDPAVAEKRKYEEAKAKALEDSEVQDLKSKADAAVGDEEARKALRNFNKTLFMRMRRIDPSIKERVDHMEVAILKLLSEPVR